MTTEQTTFILLNYTKHQICIDTICKNRRNKTFLVINLYI